MLPAHLAHGGKHDPTPKRWFVRIERLYDRWARGMLRRRYWTIALFVAASVGILVIGAMTVRFNLYPEMDIDTVWVRIELPEGSSFEHTSEQTRKVERLVRDVVPAEDLLNVTARIGHHDTDVYGMTEGRNSAWALVTVYMKPQGERHSHTLPLVAEMRRRAEKLKGFKSIEVEPLDDAPVPGKPVQIEVLGSGPGAAVVSDALLGFLRGHPGMVESWTSYKPGKDVVRLELDHEGLAARGLSVLDVTHAVRLAFDGMVIDELRTVDETIDLRLQLHPTDQGKLSTLRSLVLTTAEGRSVPLRAVAEFSVEPGQAAIRRYFGERAVTVYGDIDRMKIGTAEINDAARQFVREKRFLERYDGVRLVFGGELEQQQEALGSVAVAFTLCILGIFFVLVLLFGSITQPVLVMTVLPFSITGVVLAFALQRIELSLIALIGILGLLGVLVNDAIVLIAHLNRRRRESSANELSDDDLACAAGERLRPIVITSATTLAALAPAAYGLAGSHPFMTPMVMAIAWGVAFGTLVTLVLLPCLYAAHQDLARKVDGVWRRVRGTSPQATSPG